MNHTENYVNLKKVECLLQMQGLSITSVGTSATQEEMGDGQELQPGLVGGRHGVLVSYSLPVGEVHTVSSSNHFTSS